MSRVNSYQEKVLAYAAKLGVGTGTNRATPKQPTQPKHLPLAKSTTIPKTQRSAS